MNQFLHFSKIRRQDVAAIWLGFAVASFSYWLYLWFGFMETQPREPRPALGLIYPMNNHGWIYYLSATEATQLGMLYYMSFIVFILAAVIAGPNPVKHPWERYAIPTAGHWKYLVGSLIVSLGVLLHSSFHMATVLVSRGIILPPN